MNTDKYFKLSKQPLLFVLAEFRFPEIKKMDEYITDLQDKFRGELPFPEEQISQEIKVESQGIKVHHSKQWVFVDKLRKNAVIIGHSRIICVTGSYDRFDGFKDFCLNALNILNNIVGISFIQRIGLRYADLILDGTNLPIAKCVNSNLYAHEHFQNIGEVSQKVNDVILHTQEGIMTVRSLYGKHNLSVLPDVGNLPIDLPIHNSESERIILDFDHVWQANDTKDSLDFDLSEILDKMSKMHQLSREAFWLSTTDEARQLWQ